MKSGFSSAERGNLGAPASRRPHREWHSRDYLPHFDRPGLTQCITFRLHDSVPADVIAKWKAELRIAESHLPAGDRRMVELRKRLANYEDAGHGSCLLSNPRIAELVQNALLHFDGERYRLLAWCIMPNHVHVLIETFDGFPLAEVVHSWKSFTAKEANKLLDRGGELWMREYHDRFIRDEQHFDAARTYIEQNPVSAGLVHEAADWKRSSAGKEAGGTPALPGRR